jgi:anti-sigma-K factor RskA
MWAPPGTVKGLVRRSRSGSEAVGTMNVADPELRDLMAAEYVLGTLSGADRRRFERLLSGDRDLRDLVEHWELKLNPLADSVAPVEPAAHVWDEIARRTATAPDAIPEPEPVRESWLDRLWGSLGFWRGATALAAATAAALVVYVGLLPRGWAPEQIAALDKRLARIEDTTRGLAARPTHVAVLLDKDQRPMMTADFDSTDGRLLLRLNLTPPRDFTTNVLEVWLVSPDGTRRSLGVFPSERPGTTTALVLPHATAEALAKAGLAVSLEPRGGSTTGQPSGPVLFSGALMPVSL